MSQDYVAVFRSRWSTDDDWRALSPQAQWTYDMLLQHPDRNEAGVLSLTVKKWTRLAHGLDVAWLRAGMAELDAAGFIVVDEDTEEVLVRSFIRRAEVYKHVRLFLNALRAVSEVESDRLKSALGQELVRLPKVHIPAAKTPPTPGNTQAIAEAHQAQARLDLLAAILFDSPPDPPGQATDHPMAHPMSHPLPHGTGVGVGTGVGAGTGTAVGSSPVENKSLESNARANNPRAAPLAGLCPDHPGNLTRNCSGCAADRKAVKSA